MQKKFKKQESNFSELIKTIEFNAQRLPHGKCVYLTDAEYDRLKVLSENTKEMCHNLDEMKKQYILILRGAIQKVKSDSK